MKSFWVIVILYTSSMAHAELTVGSKAFTEGYILGELAAQKIEQETGSKVSRQFGLGSTGITLQALLAGKIDVYPEYTGTLVETLFPTAGVMDSTQLKNLLYQRGLVISEELGFENTYALAVRSDFANQHSLKKISDLKGLENKVRFAFSHEFVSRKDGAAGLKKSYGLKFGKNLQSLDHVLSYRAIEENQADVIAVYSTDDKVALLNLTLLEDDKNVFPPYKAVFLAKQSFTEDNPQAWQALNSLAGILDEKRMQNLNGFVDREQKEVRVVVANFLGREFEVNSSLYSSEIKRRTFEHLYLVGLALLISVIFGVPLGIWAHRYRKLGRIILGSSAIIQTIPSLALLSLLIPFFGIGTVPALIALCLYSLLPVITNTQVGLDSISPRLRETSKALGLSPKRILWQIEMPLASASILAGVRTATIIGIGTATLAALIGAGGYGAPIVSGLATNNLKMILTGAVPCALLSILVYIAFDILGYLVIPRGLRR